MTARRAGFLALLLGIGVVASTWSSGASDNGAVIDARQPRSVFFGHGFQAWVPDRSASPALMRQLGELRTRYVRLNAFPNVTSSGLRIGMSVDELRLIARETLGQRSANGEVFLSRLKAFATDLQSLGIQTIAVAWQVPEPWRKDKRQGTNVYKIVDPLAVDDFARLIVAFLLELRDADPRIVPAYVEPLNEPDLSTGTKVDAADYARLVRQLRGELDRAGFSAVKLVGPGTGTMRSGVPYLKDLGHEGTAALDAFSVHVWDNRIDEINDVVRLTPFVVATKSLGGKPIFVTEYNEDSDRWNAPAFACGPRTLVKVDCKGSSSYSTVDYAVSAAAQLLQLVADGANAPIFWEAQDQTWSASLGLLNAQGHPKAAALAFKAILPFIDWDSEAFSSAANGSTVPDVQAALFKSPRGQQTLVIAVRRGGQASIRLTGLDAERLSMRRLAQYPPDKTIDTSIVVDQGAALVRASGSGPYLLTIALEAAK